MGEDDLEVSVERLNLRIRAAYLYTDDGVWIAPDEARRTVRIGLTDYRLQTSGGIAFIELPERGMAFAAGEELAGIETANTDVSVSVPCEGTVLALNESLAERPELMNQDPYGDGWLVELRPAEWPIAGPPLLDARAYLDLIRRQAGASLD